MVQNQDAYMKGKIAQRDYYDRVGDALVAAMDEYGDLTGRRYDLTRAYRLDDAEYALVAWARLWRRRWPRSTGCASTTARAWACSP